jgi:hypothetical protein
LFGIDPVAVLNADMDEWIIRIAALEVIADDRKKQQEGTG